MAGISLRAVRSPVAPKITIAQGPAGRPPSVSVENSFSRSVSNDGIQSPWRMRATLDEPNLRKRFRRKRAGAGYAEDTESGARPPSEHCAPRDCGIEPPVAPEVKRT